MSDEQTILLSILTPSKADVPAYDRYVQGLWLQQPQPVGLVNLAIERDYDMMRAMCESQDWGADQVCTTRRTLDVNDRAAAPPKIAAQLAQQIKELLYGLPVDGKLSFASPVHVYFKWEACYWESFLWCHVVRVPYKLPGLIA